MNESVYETLAMDASKWRTNRDWPADSLRLCGRRGVFRGLTGDFPADQHADEDSTKGSETDRIEMLIRLAKADLLTTFVITQHVGAIKRIAAADHPAGDSGLAALRRDVLSELVSGQKIASVGISHLTTSRLHLSRPAVEASPREGGYQLSGTIPWVTGAAEVDYIVVGATLGDGKQLLVLLSPDDAGVQPGDAGEMIAMSASCTATVALHNVFVPQERVLGGPRENVLAAERVQGDAPTGAGGLQTSALALGLSYAALDYLRSESLKRQNLLPIVQRFDVEHRLLHEMIRAAANGESSLDSGEIRTNANGLVQRTTSAAMTTAKGAGLMVDHPVSRWSCQAFFFLVWSCPQPVADAHLCELAGLQ